MWRCTVRRALGFLVVATQCITAMCHGYLAVPAARNVQHNSNYCKHCLAAGGPGVTQASTRWPNSKHGVCGDPASGPLDHEAGGKFATPPRIAATYAQGQIIDIQVDLTAWHAGRFLFGLCPLSGAALTSPSAERAVVTQKCFDAHPLTNTKPIGSDKRSFWLEADDKVNGRGSHLEGQDHDTSAIKYKMRFQLPPGITCERCVLQWHYESENSCSIPGSPFKKDMVRCDQTQVMEEFWNCADIKITGGGKQPAPTKPSKKTKEKYTEYRYDTPFPAARAESAPRDILYVAVIVGVTALFMPVALAVAVAVGLVVWHLSAAQRHKEGFARPMPLLLSFRPFATSTESWLRRKRWRTSPHMEPAYEPPYREYSRR